MPYILTDAQPLEKERMYYHLANCRYSINQITTIGKTIPIKRHIDIKKTLPIPLRQGYGTESIDWVIVKNQHTAVLFYYTDAYAVEVVLLERLYRVALALG